MTNIIKGLSRSHLVYGNKIVKRLAENYYTTSFISRPLFRSEAMITIIFGSFDVTMKNILCQRIGNATIVFMMTCMWDDALSTN